MLSSTRFVSLALLLVSALNVAAAPTPLTQDGDLVEHQLPGFVCRSRPNLNPSNFFSETLLTAMPCSWNAPKQRPLLRLRPGLQPKLQPRPQPRPRPRPQSSLPLVHRSHLHVHRPHHLRVHRRSPRALQSLKRALQSWIAQAASPTGATSTKSASLAQMPAQSPPTR